MGAVILASAKGFLGRPIAIVLFVLAALSPFSPIVNKLLKKQQEDAKKAIAGS